MIIYCVECATDINARLTDGEEIYPHRRDLYELPFWICDTCHNYVGCHHKTEKPTQPLGIIPNPELRKLRQKIHATVDPLWKNGKYSRKAVYKYISDRIGWKYHTANIRSADEALEVLEVANELHAK